MRRYAVKSIFMTLQGEGLHAGTPAVFVRFSGCNVWSGREGDRARDSIRGNCAAWCDTDFVGTDGPGGGQLGAEEIADEVHRQWPARLDPGACVVVCTGGEPGLQLDAELVRVLKSPRGVHQVRRLCVETNGSRRLPLVDWVTLSPKWPMPVEWAQQFDELKVVWPAAGDPEEYRRMIAPAPCFIQPRDGPEAVKNAASAVEYAMSHPGWRLSVQTHKVLGVP